MAYCSVLSMCLVLYNSVEDDTEVTLKRNPKADGVLCNVSVCCSGLCAVVHSVTNFRNEGSWREAMAPRSGDLV